MADGFHDLDTTEPLARRVQRHDFDRLIMLSDGVFAIAITLSALEIRLPTQHDDAWNTLLTRLALPLLIYALSFAVAAFYWIGHRRTMARMARTDGVSTALSLAFLACVALIPAATQVLISAGTNGRPALTIYMGLIGVLALLQGALWAYAAFVGGLVLAQVSARYRWTHLGSTLLTPVFACTLSLIAVDASGLVRWVALAAIAALVWTRRWLLTRWAVA